MLYLKKLDIICSQFLADGTTPRLSGAATVAGDGKYALSIAESDFECWGTNQVDTQLDLTGPSDSVTHGADDNPTSWPTGDISTGLAAGWALYCWVAVEMYLTVCYGALSQLIHWEQE